MNIFRIIGDLLHAFAIFFLPISISSNKSYVGVSQRTQLLLCMVFVTRYMDLLDYFISYYNCLMKVLFIGVTMITYLMGYWYNDIETHDNFKGEVLVFFATMTAFLNYSYVSSNELCWAFSEFLEALAVIPQVHLILKTKRITNAMIVYMACTAFYKVFYCFNWLFRYHDEGYTDATSDVAGMAFLGIFGFSLMLLICNGVKTYKVSESKLKKNLFSRVMMPTSIYSISSNVTHGTGGQQLASDNAPLVKQMELSKKEKELIQTI